MAAVRHLSVRPIILGHRMISDVLADTTRNRPALAAAAVNGSGNLAVFRPHRIDLYDLGEPSAFDFANTHTPQTLAPSSFVPFQEISTPLQRVVVSASGRLAAVMTFFERVVIYNLQDSCRQVASVRCAFGTHVAFGDSDQLVVLQAPDGHTTLHTLDGRSGKIYGGPQTLGMACPVQDISRACTSADGMYLLVVGKGFGQRTCVYRRHHRPDGPWDLIDQFDGLQDGWLSHKDGKLALLHSDGVLTLRSIDGSAVSTQARTVPGRVLAFNAESSTAVMVFQEDGRPPELRLARLADNHHINLGRWLTCDAPTPWQQATASYSADGQALMVQLGHDVYVVREVARHIQILRPVGAQPPAGGDACGTVHSARISPRARPTLTARGQFVVTLGHGSSHHVALYGLVPQALPRGTQVAWLQPHQGEPQAGPSALLPAPNLRQRLGLACTKLFWRLVDCLRGWATPVRDRGWLPF